MPIPNKSPTIRFEAHWPAVVVWFCGWSLLWFFDGSLSLGNLALLLVLASAIASVWLSAIASIAASAIFVLMFNWYLIEPRYTFNVHLHQDLLLLITMMGVSSVVSYIMARLRVLVDLESHHAQTSENLRALSETLRDSPEGDDQNRYVQSMLAAETGCQVSMLLLDRNNHLNKIIGAQDGEVANGLQFCANQTNAIGPKTGRFENLPILFLPLRGRTQAYGSVAIQGAPANLFSHKKRELLQQICDVFGMEIERSQTMRMALQARQDAQDQSLRSTLLTSISHDYRTPLANLMGAISAIQEQAAHISTEKIIELAKMALSEAQHLNRITTNTLQLARLDTVPLQIKKDWESVQEILESVISKVRQRHAHRQVVVRIPSKLPLILCDAILLAQLFDNLLENAIKYSPIKTSIDIHVIAINDGIETRVMDHGPGIPDAWKERVFSVFERVHQNLTAADATDNSQVRRGMGVGLAVCRAIAKVHQAKLWVEDRQPVGAVMCVWLPVSQQPDVIPEG
jgi:two-component system sensor histidine kinase KdpD